MANVEPLLPAEGVDTADSDIADDRVALSLGVKDSIKEPELVADDVGDWPPEGRINTNKKTKVDNARKREVNIV